MTRMYSAKEIAEALNITSRAVRIRANKEYWLFTLVNGRGGQIPHYYTADLPEDVRQALTVKFGSGPAAVEVKAKSVAQRHKNSALLTAQVNQSKKQTALKEFAGLSGKPKERAEVSLSILLAAQNYAKESKLPKVAAWNQFVSEYKNRTLKSLDPSIYALKPTIGFSTLTRWESTYQKEGITGLSGKYKNTKGEGLIDATPEIKSFCLAMLSEYPHVKSSALHDAIESEFSGEYHIPTQATCARWLSKWKSENQALFMSMNDPSGWLNKRMVAFGSKSFGINRINQLWEFDSTPADVMLLDGRYSIVGVIDVTTRIPKVVLKPTSNAEAIALLIRNAILDWGMPEIVRTDNGSDYTSVHISTVWDALGIQHQTTAPYSGWEKPFIERFFRTFSHGIAELLQGYIGHSVEERQRINARLTFAERLLEKRKKGEDRIALDVQLTAEQFEAFINQWIEHDYCHKRHSALGCTPFEKFASLRQQVTRLSDPRILDILLAPVPGNKGYRTVTKDGISVSGGDYVDAELGAYVGERVFCRWNAKDVGRIYVFHALHQHFICEAVNHAIAGQGIELQAVALEAKAIQKSQLRKLRSEFKKAASKHSVSNIAQQILDHKTRQNGALSVMPKRSVEASSTAIESARAALNAADTKQQGYSEQQLNVFEQRRQQLEILEAKAKPIFETDAHKARYLTELSTRTELEPTEKAWLHAFRRSNKAAAALLDDILESAKIIHKGELL